MDVNLALLKNPAKPIKGCDALTDFVSRPQKVDTTITQVQRHATHSVAAVALALAAFGLG